MYRCVAAMISDVILSFSWTLMLIPPSPMLLPGRAAIVRTVDAGFLIFRLNDGPDEIGFGRRGGDANFPQQASR